MTDIGKRYYEHCRAMLTEAEAAEELIALTHTEPCGVIRMSCPVALLAARLGGMLGRFMMQYPRVVLHVDETNRRVDVVAEGLDLAIRVRPPPLQDSDLVLRTLAERRLCLVATPALLAQCGQPAGPMDLSHWPSMFIRDDLARGALVRVLPDWAPRPDIIHAVYASRRGQLPAVRALLDFLVEAFRALEEE